MNRTGGCKAPGYDPWNAGVVYHFALLYHCKIRIRTRRYSLMRQLCMCRQCHPVGLPTLTSWIPHVTDNDSRKPGVLGHHHHQEHHHHRHHSFPTRRTHFYLTQTPTLDDVNRYERGQMNWIGKSALLFFFSFPPRVASRRLTLIILSVPCPCLATAGLACRRGHEARRENTGITTSTLDLGWNTTTWNTWNAGQPDSWI